MSITASIVQHSINTSGTQIVTFKLRYPRFIHDEFLMHRTFSRSCSSSRAIKTSRLIQSIMQDPVQFIGLAKDQAGMQPGEPLSEEEGFDVLKALEEHRNYSIMMALRVSQLQVHKQWANRFLDLHAHISVILTTTILSESLGNFFDLRTDTDAQSEMQVLANAMRKSLDKSSPTLLQDGEWHIPLVTDRDRQELELHELLEVASARCARTSYNRHDDSAPVVAEDKALAKRLRGKRHLNPFEHCARACSDALEGQLCGNFGRGWHQYRKVLELSGLV